MRGERDCLVEMKINSLYQRGLHAHYTEFSGVFVMWHQSAKVTEGEKTIQNYSIKSPVIQTSADYFKHHHNQMLLTTSSLHRQQPLTITTPHRLLLFLFSISCS